MRLQDKIGAWAKRVKRDGVALYFATRHPATPLLVKVIGVVIVAYALSPIDLIPDFVPVLGYLDDVILLPALIWAAIRLLPPPLLEECRLQADAWMQREGRKPRSYWGAAVIVALWLAFAWWMWRLFA